MQNKIKNIKEVFFIIIPLFKKNRQENKNSKTHITVQTRPKHSLELSSITGMDIINLSEHIIYKKIRNTIPVVAAVFEKIIKIKGICAFECENKKAEDFLNNFCENVKVGHCLTGLNSFINIYLDSLLMYGNAIGEIILDNNFNIAALYNASIEDVIIRPDKSPLGMDIYVKNSLGKQVKVRNKNLILFSALNPSAGEIRGKSILNSLPFVSDILLKIFNAVGENFDRIANIKFILTYTPNENEIGTLNAEKRTQEIARAWTNTMSSNRYGEIKDFISVGGNVQIKAIGSDMKLMDSQMPAQTMIQQIVSKLGTPPFILGLNWSTTERMCDQQAKFFVESINDYRNQLNPIILKIAKTALRLNGFIENPKVVWNTINFDDEYKAAKVQLCQAQAKKLENEINA